MAFTGFTTDTLAFLSELAAHNDRTWFKRNRERYERELLEPEKLFIIALGEPLRRMRPAVEADPRVNGSIFRIQRDTRFTRDKTPYKTYTDLWFWEGPERKLSPGFFVSITADAVTTGAGTYMTEPGRLGRLREAVAADETGEMVTDILGDLGAAGYETGGRAYARVPRGFDSNHPRADLLRHNVLHASRREAVPPEFHGAEFVEWCMARFEEVRPLHEWLVEVHGANGRAGRG